MNEKINLPELKEVYQSPKIEIIEMEHEGNILQGSNFNPGGGGGDW